MPFSPFLFSFSPCHSLIAERDPFVNFQAACLVAEQAARIGFGFFTRCVAEFSLDSFLCLAQFALLFHHVNVLVSFCIVVPGRVELPTSTLSV